MAQLSDDCFAGGGELMPTDEALALLEERLTTVCEVETVMLREALGRVLAEDIVAEISVPPHRNSAVDGYAVHFDDLGGETDTRLPVVGRAAAGHPFDGTVGRGQAIRIFTGAPVPEGPDTILMQEDCRETNGDVEIAPGIKRGANLRNAGEDIAEGDTILHVGQRLRPQDLGLAASVGRTALKVYRPLTVALFSTGDEIREPGEELPPGYVYDSNRHTLTALLDNLGCRVIDLGILPDEFAAIRDALDLAARSSDLIMTSGGMSVGEEDHVKAAVEALGALHFWRLAIKPGRPMALGQVDRVPFVGLPGNPVAMMVTFLRFARPAILRLAGAGDISPHLFKVTAGFDHRKKTKRREWVRVRLEDDGAGGWVAAKFPRAGAGILSSMVEADGLIELPEDLTQLKAGTMVDYLPFSEFRL
ncbi:MAG: molybdopterin molybdotransferase MoeA [Alphaproteobacteria bacterium]|nr:molybdopterin molybdotransferase MoeA [Alphaproteobacteria bacterium]